MSAKEALDLKAGNADLSGGTTQADKIAIAADSFSTAGASLVALGSDTLDVTVAGAMDNRGGVIAGNGAVNLKVQSLDNHAGKISAAGSGPSTVQVAQQLDNTDGSIAAAGDTTVMAGDLTNWGGSVVASGQSALTVDVAGTLDNRGKGTLAAGDVTVSANALDNREGGIQHAGGGSLLLTANVLLGAGGTIATNGGLNLSGETTDLHDATTLARRINIDTGSLTTAGGSLTATGTDLLVVRARDRVDNTGGTIATNGGLDLQARSLDNQAGTMSAAGSAATRVAVTDDFDNTMGTLATAGDTKVTAAELHNQRGSILVAGRLRVTVDGLLDNRAKGTLAAGGRERQRVGARQPRWCHPACRRRQCTIVAADLQGAGGSIGSNGALDISGNTTDLSDGSTFGERIRIDTGRLLNAGKLIATGADLLLVRARDSLDNTGGTIAGNGALDMHTASLGNRDGKISAAGSADTRVEVDGKLDNDGGELVAGGSTHITAGDLSNRAAPSSQQTTRR